MDCPTELDLENRLIPPVIHGERRDFWTFLPHSRDSSPARRHPNTYAPFHDIGRTKMASLADNIKETVTWFFHSSNNANELLYSEQDYQEALAKCR
jgi:hypothetical protein